MADGRYDSVSNVTKPGLEPGRMEMLRRRAIGLHGLYLASLPLPFITMIIGVVLAYATRSQAEGTMWYSHFDRGITTFWAYVVLAILGVPLTVILVGWVFIGIAYIYVIYRAVLGLLRAINGNPDT